MTLPGYHISKWEKRNEIFDNCLAFLAVKLLKLSEKIPFLTIIRPKYLYFVVSIC